MRPGTTGRNIVVGTLYVVAFPFVLTLLVFALMSPLTFLLLISLIGFVVGPFVAAILIGMNFRNTANRVERLPGISRSGGVVSSLFGFVYVALLFGVLIGTSAGLGAVGGDSSVEEVEAAEVETVTDDAAEEPMEEETDVEESNDEAAQNEKYTLTVTVEDEATDPLGDAEVALVYDTLSAEAQELEVTGSDGVAAFAIEGGEYDIAIALDGYESTEETVSISDTDKEVTVTLTVEAEPEQDVEAEAEQTTEQSPVEDEETEIVEDNVSTQDSNDEADSDEKPADTEEVVEVPAYDVVDEGDISYAGVDRIEYYVATDQHPNELTDEELLAIAEELVTETTQEQSINAVVVHIWDDEADVGWVGNDAKVEWAPYGDWASAGDVSTGDYSVHEYAIDRPGLE